MDPHKKMFLILFNSCITIPMIVIFCFLRIRSCLSRRRQRDRARIVSTHGSTPVTISFDDEPPSYTIVMQMNVPPPSYNDI